MAVQYSNPGRGCRYPFNLISTLVLYSSLVAVIQQLRRDRYGLQPDQTRVKVKDSNASGSYINVGWRQAIELIDES